MRREQRHREFREDDRRRRPRNTNKRKRKRKKSVWTPILFVIVIILLCFVGLYGFREYTISKKVIVQSIDLTDKATAMSLVWLGQIDDNELSYEAVRECMGEIILPVTLEPIGHKMYSQLVLESDYNVCLEMAKAGLKKAYVKTVENRLRSNGYEQDITEEKIQELMQEAYDISIDDYLNQCDIKLLPTWEEISQTYSGEVEHE